MRLGNSWTSARRWYNDLGSVDTVIRIRCEDLATDDRLACSMKTRAMQTAVDGQPDHHQKDCIFKQP